MSRTVVKQPFGDIFTYIFHLFIYAFHAQIAFYCIRVPAAAAQRVVFSSTFLCTRAIDVQVRSASKCIIILKLIFHVFLFAFRAFLFMNAYIFFG